jgi:hypothetical protein
MSLTDKIAAVWQAKFFDALGCGHSEAQADRIANQATAEMRSTLAAIQRSQAPKLPRFTNLAGRRQAAQRRA